MSFPTIVYRVPGEHHRPGGTYAYRGVANEEQLQDAVADGWFLTLTEAVDGVAVVVEPEQTVVEPVEDDIEQLLADLERSADAPPTRAELEEQAKELGIGFNARTSDDALLERINKALAN